MRDQLRASRQGALCIYSIAVYGPRGNLMCVGPGSRAKRYRPTMG